MELKLTEALDGNVSKSNARSKNCAKDCAQKLTLIMQSNKYQMIFKRNTLFLLVHRSQLIKTLIE